MAGASTPDPNEIVTLPTRDSNGDRLEFEMPRWALEALKHGTAVAFYGSGEEPVLIEDNSGNVIRRYRLSASEPQEP